MAREFIDILVTRHTAGHDHDVIEFESCGGYGTLVKGYPNEIVDYEYEYGKHRLYSKREINGELVVQSSFTEDDIDFINEVKAYFGVDIPILESKEVD